MKHLSKRQILQLHAQLLAEIGGPDGLRDETLLESALDAPYAGVAGEEFYPTVEAKAARLAFGLVANHPFVDGNKPIGILAMLVLLDINGITLAVEGDDLIDLGLALAEGMIDAQAVLEWILEREVGA